MSNLIDRISQVFEADEKKKPSEDDKYTHVGSGTYVKKGQEDKEDAEKFKKDDSGKYKKMTPEEAGDKKPEEKKKPAEKPAEKPAPEKKPEQPAEGTEAEEYPGRNEKIQKNLENCTGEDEDGNTYYTSFVTNRGVGLDSGRMTDAINGLGEFSDMPEEMREPLKQKFDALAQATAKLSALEQEAEDRERNFNSKVAQMEKEDWDAAEKFYEENVEKEWKQPKKDVQEFKNGEYAKAAEEAEDAFWEVREQIRKNKDGKYEWHGERDEQKEGLRAATDALKQAQAAIDKLTGEGGDKEVPEGVDPSFKDKPGTKKFNKAEGKVYWQNGDKVFSAPADNPDAEEEITDPDYIKKLGFDINKQ